MKDYTNGPAPGFLRLWWGRGAVFALVLGAIAVIFAFVSFQDLSLAAAFDARGRVVEATVTDRRFERVQREKSSDTDYYVTFRYLADGTVFSVEQRTSQTVYSASPDGAKRDIRYLPDQPMTMEHTIGQTWRDGQIMRWVSLAAGLAALGTLWWTARPAIEIMRARKFGRAEWVTVVGVDAITKRTKRGFKTKYVLLWLDGDGQTGSSLPAKTEDRYAKYPPQTQIEVFRDSRGKSWWVGDVGSRAAASTVPDVGKPMS